MLRSLLRRVLRHQAMERNAFVGVWRRLCRPDMAEWAEYLRRHGGLRSMGIGCAISPDTFIGDPHLVAVGNNVRLAGAWLSAHDGSVNMINNALGTHFDAVAPIRLLDDVFVGKGAMILPGVKIGPRAVVGAGAVVARDVPPDSVVAGNPARVICSLSEHVAKLERRNSAMPWRPLIESRAGGFDPVMEPELARQRVQHYFGNAALER